MKTAEKVILLAFALFIIFQVCRKVDQPSLPDSFSDEDTLNHVCCDSTHELCDGWCDCDGVGCEFDLGLLK